MLNTVASAYNKSPDVFVGSSREGLPVAQAIQCLLDDDCNVYLWSQGVFGLSYGTLETLVNKASDFSFAILVLTPDDFAASRGVESFVARDNVLFELGLFIGTLGRERTYIVADSRVTLPSDLAGITVVTFRSDDARPPTIALAAKCHIIRDTIKSLGIRDTKSGNTSQSRLLDEVSSLVEEGKNAIAELRTVGIRTRYAGPFPECFKATCDLLRSATKSIKIVCDFPCYGFFSRRRLFNDYKATLLKKIDEENVAVSLVFPSRERRQELQELQFGSTDEDWTELQRDELFSDSLNEVKRIEEVEIDSIDALHKYFLDIQDNHFLNVPELRKGTKLIDAIPALYTWVVDDSVGVFTIPMFGKNAHEQGFYTSERDVVRVLASVWEHYNSMDDTHFRRDRNVAGALPSSPKPRGRSSRRRKTDEGGC